MTLGDGAPVTTKREEYCLPTVPSAGPRWMTGGTPTLSRPLGAEGGLVPSALVAVTVNTYVSPLVSPFTVMGNRDPWRLAGTPSGR